MFFDNAKEYNICYCANAKSIITESNTTLRTLLHQQPKLLYLNILNNYLSFCLSYVFHSDSFLLKILCLFILHLFDASHIQSYTSNKNFFKVWIKQQQFQLANGGEQQIPNYFPARRAAFPLFPYGFGGLNRKHSELLDGEPARQQHNCMYSLYYQFQYFIFGWRIGYFVPKFGIFLPLVGKANSSCR